MASARSGMASPSALSASTGMVYFPDGYPVRLRNIAHGTYLHADKDGHGVSLSPRRYSMKVAWYAHHYHGDEYNVLLHSAAYGRYLYATEASAPLGCIGLRVEQRNYDELDDEAIRWEPVMCRSGHKIMLSRHIEEGDRYGFLRGNGRHITLNDSVVSVDDVRNISTDMVQWVVERVRSSERIPRLPRPRFHLSDLLLSRVVMCTGDGQVLIANAVSFTFRGRSVYRLKNELVRRLGIPGNDYDNLVMYVRAGTHGRNTPLVANLSRSRQTLVITTDMPANGGPRHPDFS